MMWFSRGATALKALCLVLSSAFMHQGLTLTPEQIASSYTVRLYATGSSNQDEGLKLALENLCVSPVTTYRQAENRAYACRLVDSIPGLFNPNASLVFYKEASLGTALGLTALANSSPVEFITIDALTCNGGAPITEGSSVDCTESFSRSATIAVSETGFPLFYGSENSRPGTQSLDEFSFLGDFLLPATTYGIVVSMPLFKTLQHIQGLDTNDDESDVDGEDNTPTLPRGLVSRLFWDGLMSWDNVIMKGQGPHAGQIKSVVAWAEDAGVSLETDRHNLHDIKICRRAPGSGTQAQFNALFMQNPCVGNVRRPRAPDQRNDDPSGFGFATQVYELENSRVIGNISASGVEACMETFGAGNRMAIGFQSLLRNSLAAGNGVDVDGDGLRGIAKDYRFVKLNKAAPTLDNIDDGLYKDWAQARFVFRPDRFFVLPDQVNVLQALTREMNHPQVVAELNQNFVHPFGTSGHMVLATAETFPADLTRHANTSSALDSVYPVAAYERYDICLDAMPNNHWQDVVEF